MNSKNMHELHWLNISEAAAAIAARELSPVDLVEALLARIEALDAQINAFITVTAEQALDHARAAEREITSGRYRGSLHGIPFALKDVIETAGIRTTAHSKILEHNVPQHDAAVVTQLHEAGAVLMGKLATHEFAHGGPSFDLPWPPARNPWDRARFTGGSSSGSGAAVAAGFVPAALGTDTGGSIRIPAAMCGVTGLKPTYDLVSRAGIIPNSFSYDHCGPLARSVEDCAIVLQAVAGKGSSGRSTRRALPDYRAGLNGDIRGMRIGVVRHFWEEDLQAAPSVCAAMNAAIEVFAGLGAKIETVRLRPLREYTDVNDVISRSELFSVHQKTLAERAGDYGAIMRSRIFAFCLFQAADYMQAQRERRRMIAEMAPVYERFDILLNAGPGPAGLLADGRSIGLNDKWEKPKLPAAFSTTAGPALVLCNGFDDAGLPLAMEIAGRPFDEATVLRAGHAYQCATSWTARRPILVTGANAPVISADDNPVPAPAIDEGTRRYVDAMAVRAGLKLTPGQKAQLYEAAPHALALVKRIAHGHAYGDEPASSFHI